MNPQLAALLTWIFVLVLLWRENKRSTAMPGLWVATLWFTILATRVPSYWFDAGGTEISVEAYEDGNSFNQIVYGVLIFLGMIVLWWRRTDWDDIVRRNQVLFLFFGYCVLSAVWAEYPFVSLKGSIKAVLGNLVMVLIVVTDRDPVEAIKTMIRRCAIVFLPFSVMAIKYFPEMGRGTHRYTYETFYTGIATGSNGLSTTCFICGLIIIWDLIRKGARADKKDFGISLLLFLMMVWLLNKADGDTAELAMMLAVAMLLLLRFDLLKQPVLSLGRNIGLVWIALTPIVVLNYNWFMDAVSLLFGHSETLYGRLELWRKLVAMAGNPFLGMGYNTFFQGERLTVLWADYWWRPTQAHNGYVETYLNLGLIGVALLALLIVAGGRKITDRRLRPEFQYLKVPYVVPLLFFNLTEAGFRGLHPAWFIFLLLIIETRQQMQPARTAESVVTKPKAVPKRAIVPRWARVGAPLPSSRPRIPNWTPWVSRRSPTL
jgi:O-antigen ligase